MFPFHFIKRDNYTHLSRHLPSDGNYWRVAKLKDSIDFSLHHVHSPLRHEARALRLLPAVLQAFNDKRFVVGDLKWKVNTAKFDYV